MIKFESVGTVSMIISAGNVIFTQSGDFFQGVNVMNNLTAESMGAQSLEIWINI